MGAFHLKAAQGCAHRGDGHHAIAQRGVQLMGNAGHQRPQRGQLFSAHQFILRSLQGFQRGREAVIGLYQFLGAFLHAALQVGVEMADFVFNAAQLGDVTQHDDCEPILT